MGHSESKVNHFGDLFLASQLAIGEIDCTDLP